MKSYNIFYTSANAQRCTALAAAATRLCDFGIGKVEPRWAMKCYKAIYSREDWRNEARFQTNGLDCPVKSCIELWKTLDS